MAEFIDKQAFLEGQRHLYCENCEKRKGMKRGKMQFVYEIGDAPCRSCGYGDVLDDLEDFPAADAIVELIEERDAYRKAMTDEHNRAAKLDWEKEHCWIPVTERLPFAESGDVSEKVLVTDGQDMAIAELFNFEMCEPYWSYTGMGDITHWMPLPEPTKEE